MSDVGLGMDRGRRSPSPGRAKGCLAVVIALAVLGGAGWFAYVEGRDWLEETFALTPDYRDYAGDGRGSVIVEVREGETSTDIAERLRKAGVVASEEAFVDVALQDDRAASIQAGHYRLARRMSAQAAFERLLDPANLVRNEVTVPEGYTVEQILDRLASDTDLSRRAVARAARQPRRLGLPDYAGGELEGYLFPATYQFPPDVTATEALRAMVQRFEQAADRLRLERRARALGLSPHEAVTVASIVQSEVHRPEDMLKVARVIYNRLDIGMPLQMDSTVHYAVGRSGGVTTSDEERQVRSPYNTYRVTGLPPGPISAPGEAALAAALRPAEGEWLYFVTVNQRTGQTRFAATMAQHQRNIAEFQRWCAAHPGQC